MPSYVSLFAVVGRESLTPAAIAARWRHASDSPPRTPIGVAADGTVVIDLVRDGPHALIAGTTGSGKSELLRSLVVGMSAHASPEQLTFVLVDYKGGAAFDACDALPHVVGVVTDLDDQMADRALRSLHAELRRRERLLRDNGAADLVALRSAAPHVILPRLVVVVDEFASLVAEQPEFLHSLVGIAQRGRSLGVHLVLATQRPGGVISDDIRANTSLRLALRMHDAADAIDVVGDRSPATLPRGVPGRAVLRLGSDERVTFQTASTAVGDLPLAGLVHAIADAARLTGALRPAAPWAPALPAALTPGAIAPEAIGLVDDPDNQRVLPLCWDPGDGWTVVAGSSQRNVSDALRLLVAASLRDPVTVAYVLTGGSVTAWSGTCTHPRVAIVGVHEHERVARLLHRLQRRDGRSERMVLVVDGLTAVRRALDSADSIDELEALDRLLAGGTGGAGGDLTVVAGTHHAGALPVALLARSAQRWLLHVHDRADAAALGAAPTQVPPPMAGRVFLAHRGLMAQLATPPDAEPVIADAGDGATARISVLPRVVPASAMPPGWAADSATHLPVGAAFGTDAPAVLELPEGEHVLVVGPGRSGRSTTLARLATAWQQAHPHGYIGWVNGRRSGRASMLRPLGRIDELGAGCILSWDASLAASPRLLVVDDAELVDDPALCAVAAGAVGLCILAAGRPDALRAAYGHWTSVVRRSRIGVVAVSASDADGELLGEVLPRRTPVAPRPGLVWLVQHGRRELVQVAAACDAGTLTGAAAQ